ncbi:hypothetical protein HHL16_12490 [Pseudoflavitalea sp. G-6-1-2]|uniref:hypothetical protein n=1 Tax=Pseudoflavitalea sp. G-6-1-2 TaxID=2728841 RepID=UPI00146A4542|nr:hypothetical protein [Pseudoflavitalea sp. G-6-1-2]NML21701.1 hypothetical protein [Pseudoflavitalea sp. G-6-1-2]
MPAKVKAEKNLQLDLGQEKRFFQFISDNETYTNFIANIADRLSTLQQTMFDVYVKFLKQEGEDSIETLEEHSDYIRGLAFIRIEKGNSVELC